MDFSKFLSGMPAKDYIFQHIPYEKQIVRAAEMIKNTDAVLIGVGAGLSTAVIWCSGYAYWGGGLVRV